MLQNLLCTVATCLSGFTTNVEPCAASPIAPPLPIKSASVTPAALFLLILTNCSFPFFMAFLQLGFATSHPRMLKLKVSFKSSLFSKRKIRKDQHENRPTRPHRRPQRLRHPLLRKTRPARPAPAPRRPAPFCQRCSLSRAPDPLRHRHGLHPRRNQAFPQWPPRQYSRRAALEKARHSQAHRSRAKHRALPQAQIPSPGPPPLPLPLTPVLRQLPPPQPQTASLCQ